MFNYGQLETRCLKKGAYGGLYKKHFNCFAAAIYKTKTPFFLSAPAKTNAQ